MIEVSLENLRSIIEQFSCLDTWLCTANMQTALRYASMDTTFPAGTLQTNISGKKAIICNTSTNKKKPAVLSATANMLELKKWSSYL